MYAAIFAIIAAIVCDVGMAVYSMPVYVAAGLLIAAIAIGFAIDELRMIRLASPHRLAQAG